MDGTPSLAARPKPASESLIGRRIDQREACQASVEVRHGGGWHPAVLRDISRTGFRVALRRTDEAGAALWLRLGSVPPLPAKVCWREGELAGCKFLYPLDEKQRTAIWQELDLGARRARASA